MECEIAVWLDQNLTWLMAPKAAKEMSGDEVNMIENFDPIDAAFVDNETGGKLFNMASESYTLIRGKYDGRTTFMVTGAHFNEARTGFFVI